MSLDEVDLLRVGRQVLVRFALLGVDFDGVRGAVLDVAVNVEPLRLNLRLSIGLSGSVDATKTTEEALCKWSLVGQRARDPGTIETERLRSVAGIVVDRAAFLPIVRLEACEDIITIETDCVNGLVGVTGRSHAADEIVRLAAALEAIAVFHRGRQENGELGHGRSSQDECEKEVHLHHVDAVHRACLVMKKTEVLVLGSQLC